MHGFFVRLAVLVLTAALANAGDCLTGSTCCNQCPLAKQANSRLSDGGEGLVASGIVRADIVRRVFHNMEAL